MRTQQLHKTFILADSRLTREGMMRILEDTSFEVVGQSGQFSDLLEHVAGTEPPRILLIDIAGRESELRGHLDELRGRAPEMRVVLLTEGVDPQQMAECFEAGVDGFLLKDISTEALLASLELALIGERVFPSQVIPLLLRGAAGLAPVRRETMEDITQLSTREMQILRCLVDGNPNKVIAQRLDMAEATIKVHVKNILRKIKAENRTQAAIWALHHGIAAASDNQPAESTGRDTTLGAH
jgi:two-component system nitrate/nitrite response regulator NarL